MHSVYACMLDPVRFDVPYIPVESLSMQERVRLVDRVLQLGGLRPAHQSPHYLPTCNKQTGVIQPRGDGNGGRHNLPECADRPFGS